MAIRTPPIYATGKWQVKQPFSVESNTIYVCKAIRSLDDVEARGIDAYATFYEPYGISRSDYDDDVMQVANIVTLMSSTAATLYIPDTYILSFPDTTTMPYSHTVLSISLGAVPDTLSLDDTRQKIEDLVLSSLGIESRIFTHVSGVISEGVDFVTHRSLENQRLARIENNTSSYGQLVAKDAEIEALRERIRALEEILVETGVVE